MPSPHPITSAWKIIPHFPSRSIQATIKFYTSILGFTLSETYVHTDHRLAAAGEPTFASLFAGDKATANIYFFLTPKGEEGELAVGRAMIALGKKEVEELYGKLKGLEEDRARGGREGEGEGGGGRWRVGDFS
jgi:catechol 2,3-dioxygenase-like lactoylglutathione lyase family enzyme